MKEYSVEVQSLLKQVVDDCAKEDTATRERQLRDWKKLKLLWEGFSQIWFSQVAHDWRIYDPNDSENQQDAYDKPINVFRAYLESIIAALSITVPPIKCYPDDADNTLDLSTARAGDQIAALIFRHNNAPLLWLHALFVGVTEGMVCCYNYVKSDDKFGTYEEKEYEDTTENHDISSCPNCGHELGNQLSSSPDSNTSPGQITPPPELNGQSNIDQQQQQPDPQMGQVPPQSPPTDENEILELQEDEFDPSNEPETCPNCQQTVIPTKSQETLVVTKLIGITNEPKSRMCLEVYGGMNVKISNFARTQSKCTYLLFDEEIDYCLAIEEFDHLHENDKIQPGAVSGDSYDQYGRLSAQYQGEYPTNVVTKRMAWIRPAKFNILPNDDAKKLKKLFKNGVKVTLINNEYACAEPESLDDHWTIAYNPLSDNVHFNPLGSVLSNIQEITSDLISLVLQTIEHGIGSTFADPAVLNFKAYGETEVVPGAIFPAKPVSGKSIGDGFYELRTATLSAEVLPFSNQIQSLGQLVSGALPSLFGGQLEGSDTASEYSMSRAQSLQRLQTTWKMLTSWWKEVYGKVIPMYIKEIKEDEKDVQRDKETGNFINVFIRKAEMEGKIGKVELEANENIPLTWNQRKDALEKLLQNTNENVVKLIASPENTPLIHEALGISDFFVPGEADREKQYDEIKLLLNSEPIVQPPQIDPMTGMMGQETEVPSIEIEQDVDDSEVQYTICRKWLVSEAGRQAKIDNEKGYRNVLLHAKLHLQVVQMSMQPQQPQPGQPNQPKPPGGNTQAPIQDESHVQTIQ
jgi:hypothetical protein